MADTTIAAGPGQRLAAGGRMPDGGLPRGRAEIVNLPNIVSFARLCAVPLAVWLVLRHELAAACALFAAAGVSDAIDGWLARRRGGSPLGALLDPMADKALLISMFITLAAIGVLPDWIAILVVFRDVVIVGGVLMLWLTSAPVRIRPLWISKLNTALQLLLVGLALLLEGFGVQVPYLLPALVWAVAGTTLFSGALYVWRTAR